jgi:tellurite resistance protein TehA-like permease
MNAPQNNTSLVSYALAYVVSIAAIVADIHHGGVLFTLIGFASSIVLSALVIYRMARAMALGPTPMRQQPARLEPAVVSMSTDARLAVAAA